MTTQAIDVNVSVCINGNTIDVVLENERRPTNQPIAWDGNSFIGASFAGFDNGEEFPPMVIDGELNGQGTMTITVAARGGTSMMDIAFIDNSPCIG